MERQTKLYWYIVYESATVIQSKKLELKKVTIKQKAPQKKQGKQKVHVQQLFRKNNKSLLVKLFLTLVQIKKCSDMLRDRLTG